MLRRAALGLFLLVCAAIHAQTIYPPINSPVFRALDANGNPLAGGKLYSYAAGSSTPLATYADATTGTPNPNPVPLDANGQAKIFLGPSVYKLVLQDANGVQQWTVDSISGKPAPSAVTSVFGRTGSVAALSGDYTCGQVTGAVCSLPTLYYQTMQVAGAGQTQRSKLNFLSGANINVTCADNSGNDSTDCTVAYTGTGGTSRTCGSNGCYTIAADGTIDAWGVSAAVSGSTTATTLAITFPTTFTSLTNLNLQVSAVSDAAGDGNPHPADCHVVRNTMSITGATAVIAISTQVSGSGYDHLVSGDYCTWHATGY